MLKLQKKESQEILLRILDPKRGLILAGRQNYLEIQLAISLDQ